MSWIGKKAADVITSGQQLINGTITAAKFAAGAVVSHLGYTPANKAGDTIQSGAWLDYQTGAGVSLKGVRAIPFGYGAPYTALQIGNASGNQNLSLGVDVSAITGGNFSGNGKDIVVPNAVNFMMPNAANTDFIKAMGFDTNGNLQFNSGYGSAAVAYGCRAWVNFNGTGTVAIRASGNVSSITDNGTGDYTVNFSTAMPDANYSITGITTGYSASDNAGVSVTVGGSLYTSALLYTTSSVRVSAGRNGTPLDGGVICVNVFR